MMQGLDEESSTTSTMKETSESPILMCVYFPQEVDHTFLFFYIYFLTLISYKEQISVLVMILQVTVLDTELILAKRHCIACFT